MMDCKRALTEAEGDMTRAEEILRVRFGNKASKAAGRVAAEGTVGISISADGKSGAMIEVNSETDFCAKNEDFLKFVNELAGVVAVNKPANIEAVGALKMRDSTAEETRAQLVGKIGENITPVSYTHLDVYKRQELTQNTGVAVYFADPHSPWQRGINENTNGLLRQYLPKGEDLNIFSQEELDAIAWKLNTRPRKSLGFKCPAELFTPDAFDFRQHHAALFALQP